MTAMSQRISHEPVENDLLDRISNATNEQTDQRTASSVAANTAPSAISAADTAQLVNLFRAQLNALIALGAEPQLRTVVEELLPSDASGPPPAMFAPLELTQILAGLCMNNGRSRSTPEATALGSAKHLVLRAINEALPRPALNRNASKPKKLAGASS